MSFPNLRFSLRYLLKMRGGTPARVLSLSMGLAAGVLVISFAGYRLTTDRCFRDGERIYRLWYYSDKAELTGFRSEIEAPIAPAMAAEMPQIEAATCLYGPEREIVVHDGDAFEMSCLIADTMFFDVLGFEALQGDPRKALAHENQIMISESAARRIFRNRDPVGELLLLNGTDSLTVEGVFRDPDPNQHLGGFELLRSFAYAPRILNISWNGGDSFAGYVKLRPGARIDEVEAQVPAFIERHGMQWSMEAWNRTLRFFPIADTSQVGSSMRLVSWVLMALAALTLFVAAMNYVLVSVSSLVGRSKTLAMLKVGGARRGDIFRIFLSETAILTLLSALAAAFLLWAFQDELNAITGTPLGVLFAPRRIYVPLLVILSVFALAAIVPSQLFTSVPLTQAFRGATDSRRRWKQALLATEIVGCTLTLTLLTLTVMQFHRLRHGDFGFEHDRLVYTRIEVPLARLGSVGEAVAALPEVEAAGVTEELPVMDYSGMPCMDERTGEILFSARCAWVDEGYLPAMGIELVAGRNFTPSSHPLEAIVNETYVRLRGWSAEEALGREIRDPGDRYRVVGVVRDFRTVILTGRVEPLVIHPTAYYTLRPRFAPEAWWLMIRLGEMSTEAMDAVQSKIKSYPSGNNHTLTVYDRRLGDLLADVRNFRDTVFAVSLVTLLIALVGLIGYLGDEINRRSREIAVRKVVGASAGDVLRLVAAETMRVALPAVVAGAVAGRLCADFVVENFVDRVPLRPSLFVLCAVAVLAVVLAVQFIATWRIARADPIERIRTE